MNRAIRITSNRPCHEIGTAAGYTAEQWARLLQQALVVVPIRCMLGASNITNSARIARDLVRVLREAEVKVLLYAQLMHRPSIVTSPWAWETSMLSHGPALRWIHEENGEQLDDVAVRQARKGERGDWLYSDPRKWRWAEWAQLVGKTVSATGASGVLVDHLQRQFTGEAGPVLNENEALVDDYRAKQLAAMVALRDEVGPDSEIIPNGSWPLDDPGLVGRMRFNRLPPDTALPSWDAGPTSGLYVERMGGQWYSPKGVAPLLAWHLREHEGIVLLDPRWGGKTVVHYEDLIWRNDGTEVACADDLNDTLATHWAEAFGDRAYVVERW